MKLGPLRSESDELMHLDLLRFVAATGIVIYHLRGQMQLGEGASAVTGMELLSLLVDLFFFISGFVITRFYGTMRGSDQYASFMWKRLARLYPLHLATALAFAAIAVAYQFNFITLRHPEQLDLSCLPANLALIHAAGTCHALSMNAVSWSISAEMMIYAVFPALLLLRRAGTNGALVAGLLVAAVLTAVAGPSVERPWYEWTFDYGVLRALPSFLLGMACYDARTTLTRLPYPTLWLWTLCAIFAVAIAIGADRLLTLIVIYGIGAAAVAADV